MQYLNWYKILNHSQHNVSSVFEKPWLLVRPGLNLRPPVQQTGNNKQQQQQQQQHFIHISITGFLKLID